MVVIFEDSDAEMNVLVNFNPDMVKTFNPVSYTHLIKTAREKLMLLEAANNYCDYINYEKELVKVNTAIDSRMIEDEDIASELNRLAAIYKQYYDKAEKELSDKTAKAAIDEMCIRDRCRREQQGVWLYE